VPSNQQPRSSILITGANGYIGLRLITALSATDYHIIAAVRNKERLPKEITSLLDDRLTIIEIDFLLSLHNQPSAPLNIQAAYYLIHSMGSGPGFTERETTCAKNFIKWTSNSNTQQIIYLSGLLPQKNEPLSNHLASRNKVYQILGKATSSLTTLRASIIVGSGSASFEIIRDLTEKLPIMITPKWVNTLCQPISIRNVIDYLIGVFNNTECFNKSFDIGGPETLTYGDMLRGYAKARKLKRFLITVPVFSPSLSSYWLSIVTATNYQLARALVGSLHMETICQESSIQKIIPLQLIDYPESIERAFSKIAQNRVPSTWYGALSSGTLSLKQIKNIQVPEYGILNDKQTIALTAPKKEVIQAIFSLGGKRGWPNMLWAWKLRGLMDQIIGGIGMRRGRRSLTNLKPGDALDFWRVVLADTKQGRLMLYAEMKLPGEAWLEFEIKDNYLHQTATFRPKGLFGRLYWYSTYPFHLILFPKMAKILANGWKQKS